MTATNHAVTGALIGLIVGQPLIALPAAFLSHFICDAIPHYGDASQAVWSRSFKRMLMIDASLCILLVLSLAYRHPVHWLLAAVCAFVATSPDLLWVRKFTYGLKHHRQQAQTKLDTLLGSDGIQWFQRPIGAVVEVAWLAGGISLLAVIVK